MDHLKSQQPVLHETLSRFPVRSILAWSIWIGVSAGCLELAIFWGKCTFLDPRNMNVSRQMVWMFPVAGLLIVASLGLAFSVFSTIIRQASRSLYVLCSLFFVAYVALLFRAPIYTSICLLLAGSAAWKTACYIDKRLYRLDLWIVGRVWIPLSLLALLIALGTGREFWQGSFSTPANPDVHKTRNRKNVILIVMDTVRAESLSLYGHPRESSPQLTKMSGRGVRFERAFSTAPWTAPSHASIFTGHLPHELSIAWDRPLDSTYPTLAEALASQGYATAGFVANTTYCSYETGLDRGFTHYEDYEVTFRAILLCSSIVERSLNFLNKHPNIARLVGDGDKSQGDRKNASRMNRDVLKWIDTAPKEKPFFAFINYYDAHHPYLSPEVNKTSSLGRVASNARDFRLLKTWWERDKLGLDLADRELARDSYEQCIAYLDDQIGQLFEELTTRGILENSIVIITSDHGEHLGEHNLYGHGCSVYGPELHVPLIIVAPGMIPAASVFSDSVSLRDIPSTVMSLLDLNEFSPFPGESLTRFMLAKWQRSQVSSDVFSELQSPPELDPNGGRSPATKGAMISIVSQGLHYIRNGDGREELYDMDRDHEEIRDLVDVPEMSIALSKMRKSLRR